MPLYAAALCYSERNSDCLEKAEMLLEAGADVNRQMPGLKQAAIHQAAHAAKLFGHTRLGMLLLLLDNGADPRLGDSHGANVMRVILEYANIANGFGEDAERMREWANRLQGEEQGGRRDAERERAEERDRELLNEELIGAAYVYPPDVVRRLLDEGADPNAWTAEGPAIRHALHYATRCYIQSRNDAEGEGCLENMRILLEAGADVNEAGAGDPRTPLVYAAGAAEQGRLLAALLLLEHGADPRIEDFLGNSAVGVLEILAAEEGPGAERAREWMRKLGMDFNPDAEAEAEAPADPNARDAEDRSLLQRALEAGDADLARALLAAGANPNERTSDGRRPMMVAVESFLPVDLLKDMVDAGCDPAMWDYTRRKFAALHRAVAYSPEAVRALLSGGADVNVRDGAGFTPLFWASEMREETRSGTQEEDCPDLLGVGGRPDRLRGTTGVIR